MTPRPVLPSAARQEPKFDARPEADLWDRLGYSIRTSRDDVCVGVLSPANGIRNPVRHNGLS